MKNTEMFIIRTWDEFRELCKNDACSWHDAGYKSSEINAEDILNEYPEDFFITEYPDDDDILTDENVFTAADVVTGILLYMRTLEDEEADS